MELVTQIYTEKQRNARIKKEKERLAKIFKKMDPNKAEMVEKLIQEAAFQAATLDETREIIKKTGVVEEYQNGANQKGVKKSSAVEVYDKLVNTYSRIIRQLCDMLPVEGAGQGDKEKDPAEELLEYVSELKR